MLVVQVISPHQLLGDVLVLGGVGGNLDALDVVLLQRLGQAAHFTGEGGAGHQGLALDRQGLGDVLDVVDEAHVQHAVGFVQHQHLDVLKNRLAAAQVVDQTAGSGDQDVQRHAQSTQLIGIRHAADDGGHAQVRHKAAVVCSSLGHLHGQFTGGHQHQNARATHFATLGLLGGVFAGFQHLHQGRQHKGGGLAAARAGADAQVAASQSGRHSASLNVGGVFVACGLKCAQKGLIEAKGFECHNSPVHRPSYRSHHAWCETQAKSDVRWGINIAADQRTTQHFEALR